jgi:hypothetical protein
MINIKPLFIETLVYNKKLEIFQLEEAKIYIVKDLTEYPAIEEKMLLVKLQEPYSYSYNSKNEFIFCSLETSRCRIFQSPFEFEIYSEY